MGRFSNPLSLANCGAIFLSLFSGGSAKPLENPTPVAHLLPRQTITPGGQPCGENNATNRFCWKNNWNVSTDYEFYHPPAFNTRTVSSYLPTCLGIYCADMECIC